MRDGENAQTINFNNFDYHIQSPQYPNGNFTGTHRTVTVYDGTRRAAVVDALGNTTSFIYDSLGRAITTVYPAAEFEGSSGQQPTYSHVEYDGLGRKSFESQQTDQSNHDYAIGKSFEYDLSGRLTKVILPAVTGGTPEYRYFYDTFGNMVGILDPLNRMTVFEYDEFNRQIFKFMPFAFVDPTGGEITVDYIYESIPAEQKYQMSFYDDFGRIEYSADYMGQITSYAYDSQGRLEYKKYYLNETDYTADEPDAVVQYAYDSLGRKEQVIDSRHGTTAYTYDAEGRITSVDTPEGTINYEYNSITGQKTSTSTSNTSLEYYYDELGRLETVNLTKRNGIAITPEQADYSYNAVGSRESLIYPNNNHTYCIYDALNRLTSLTNFEQIESNPQSPAGNVLSKFEYQLYADGMRKKAIEQILPKDGVPGTTPLKNQIVEYTYDNLNRLTKEAGVDPCTPGNSYTVEYEYNLVGSRLNRSIYFGHSSSELYTEYEYNDKDQLIRETHSDTIPSARIDLPDGVYLAYAGGNGLFYNKAGSPEKIGAFSAWFKNLPSSVSHWLFGLAMAMLVIAFFIPAIVHILIRMSGRDPAHMPLSLKHRCLSVLIAYVMLISPAGFEKLAEASVNYSELGVSSWGAAGDVISYCYDANGSLVYKFYDFFSTIASTDELLAQGIIKSASFKLGNITINAEAEVHLILHSRMKLLRGLATGDLVPADNVKTATAAITALKKGDIRTAREQWYELKNTILKYGDIKGTVEIEAKW